MDFGKNIRQLREERGLTQEKLAEALHVSFQAVSAWERDEYKPETDNLIRMAEVLDVSVSCIVEEKSRMFETQEVLYNWEHMKTFVKTSAKNHGLRNTLKAVDYAVEAHKGQTRKKSTVPYIYHPLNMACHALSMGILEDEVVAACLLHDVIEDCGKRPEDLPVNEETREIVRLLTMEEKSDDEDVRKRILAEYYGNILADSRAALVKCMDRCNNMTTMAWGLSRDRIYRMINETEAYYPKLIKAVKAVPEYNNAAWLLQYQIESMLDIYKRLL